jgi:hypothetical protein
MEFFGEAARDLSPTAEVSPSTIRGLRVRRDVVDDVAWRLNRPYTYQDGSYYFRAEV